MLPALELIEAIPGMMMVQMTYKRKCEANTWTTRLTPKMQARLNKRVNENIWLIRVYKVRQASERVFEGIS